MYILLEKIIVGQEIDSLLKEKQILKYKNIITKSIQTIKLLSMKLQRSNPSEWNSFLNITIKR